MTMKWTTAEGETLELWQMSDEHLFNVEQFLRRRLWGLYHHPTDVRRHFQTSPERLLDAVCEELQRRKTAPEGSCPVCDGDWVKMCFVDSTGGVSVVNHCQKCDTTYDETTRPMTVRQLIQVLQEAKNPDMVVAVCDEGVPYREITGVKDNTGSFADSEVGKIDGLFLLFARP